jgi:alpha-amylase
MARVSAGTFLAAGLLVLAPGCGSGEPVAADGGTHPDQDASGSGDVRAGVLLQAFYWNVPVTTPSGSWWNNLGAKAAEWGDAGFTAVWLPPPYKGKTGADDVGYGVYDRYDLGEFNQKGAVPTRYGTRAELQQAISALHAHGVAVYADVVMNHMNGADRNETVTLLDGSSADVPTGFDFAARGGAYSSYVWSAQKFNGVQQGGVWKQWHAWDFQPYLDGGAYDNLLDVEIRYADADNRAELIRWGGWLTDTLSLDGYRLDATKHMWTDFVNEWLDTLVVGPKRFAVSEAFIGDVDQLKTYADMLGGRTFMFDFPLHFAFVDMSTGNGSYDMRKLAGAGFSGQRPNQSVSFVENHDTDNVGGSPVVNFKMLAYAYILTHAEGYPCVFYKDYYEYGLGPKIRALMQARKLHGFGTGSELPETDADLYAYARAGDAEHTGLLTLLNDGASSTRRQIKTPLLNQALYDVTGNQQDIVATDAHGVGQFPIGAASWGVWVQK